MKSILLSIKPKYCELIASGQKTVEIRKNRPKIDTPFKCYIYCTKPKQFFSVGSMWLASDDLYRLPNGEIKYGCSFELACHDNYTADNFLCGKVIGEFVCDNISIIYPTGAIIGDVCTQSCLTAKEIADYQKGEWAYAWYISNLVIYDKPKELSELYKPNIPKAYSDLEGLKHPPQNWCYVEELEVSE